MTEAKPILAILVLHGMGLAESPTYRSLQEVFAHDAALKDAIELVVADNSPVPHPVPAGFRGSYVHDGQNAGLAPRYQTALEQAALQGSRWLLTLDQDTDLTLGYVREACALAESLRDNRQVAVIVPRLKTGGVTYSPAKPRFGRSPFHLDEQSVGVVGAPVRAFNSAALVRVDALMHAGGYPQAYWLDYLDHATFARLQQRGGRIYIMRAVLQHALAEFSNEGGMSPQRMANVIRAEERFHYEYGSFDERFHRKLDLLRQVIGHLRRGRITGAAEKLALFFRSRRSISGLDTH